MANEMEATEPVKRGPGRPKAVVANNLAAPSTPVPSFQPLPQDPAIAELMEMSRQAMARAEAAEQRAIAAEQRADAAHSKAQSAENIAVKSEETMMDAWKAQPVPKTTVQAFLDPDAMRPSTEYYWVTEKKGAKASFTLIEDKILSMTLPSGEHHSERKEKCEITFGISHTAIGTDLGDYWPLVGDLTKIPDVIIAHEDLNDPALRLPEGTVEKPIGKHYLKDLIVIMDRVIRNSDGPRTFRHKDGTTRMLMTGEEFRLWAASKYLQKWQAEETLKVSKAGFASAAPNEVKTGAALKQMLKNPQLVGAGV